MHNITSVGGTLYVQCQGEGHGPLASVDSVSLRPNTTDEGERAV